MNIKQRHFIKSTEIKTLKQDILKKFEQEFIDKLFPAKSKVELILTENDDILYSINGELKLWKSKKHGFIPVLTQLLNRKLELKKIMVDKGAISHVCNGADIMRPGITKIDPSIKKDDIIVVVDETHNRALAVGKAMYAATEMEKINSGKVVLNLHTIQDSVWEFEKEFK